MKHLEMFDRKSIIIFYEDKYDIVSDFKPYFYVKDDEGKYVSLFGDKLKKIEPQYNYLGIIFLLIGIFFPISGIGDFHLQFLGFIVFSAGLIYVIFGKELFKNITFPLFFLMTIMILCF